MAVTPILDIHRKLLRPALTPQRNERIRALPPEAFALLADLCKPHSWGSYIDTYVDTHAYLTAARVERDTLCDVCNALYYDLPHGAHHAMSDHLRAA